MPFLLTQYHMCNSTKKRKEYLVLTCGPPSLTTATPKAKHEDEESCSDDESNGDEENQTVSAYAILYYPHCFSSYFENISML